MNMKPLKLYNGRFGRQDHIFIAAYSNADAARILDEAYQTIGYGSSGMLNEINVYFSKGCWGNPMEGITPERGAWVEDGRFRSEHKITKII